MIGRIEKRPSQHCRREKGKRRQLGGQVEEAPMSNIEEGVEEEVQILVSLQKPDQRASLL